MAKNWEIPFYQWQVRLLFHDKGGFVSKAKNPTVMPYVDFATKEDAEIYMKRKHFYVCDPRYNDDPITITPTGDLRYFHGYGYVLKDTGKLTKAGKSKKELRRQEFWINVLKYKDKDDWFVDYLTPPELGICYGYNSHGREITAQYSNRAPRAGFSI